MDERVRILVMKGPGDGRSWHRLSVRVLSQQLARKDAAKSQAVAALARA